LIASVAWRLPTVAAKCRIPAQESVLALKIAPRIVQPFVHPEMKVFRSGEKENRSPGCKQARITCKTIAVSLRGPHTDRPSKRRPRERVWSPGGS
jgi:hypothetical protein